MIISAPAVASNFANAGDVGADVGGVVIQRHGNDGTDTGHHLANVLTSGVVHPGQICVVALGQPALQGLVRCQIFIPIGHTGNADLVKTDVQGFLLELGGGDHGN